MGEYAKHNGHDIKIGTCESMYYLRFSQLAEIETPVPHSLDARLEAHELRFRFPFPDEDGTAPGCFGPFDRGIAVPNYISPASVTHSTIQLSHPIGYVVSLPCPESAHYVDFRGARALVDSPHVHVYRNGFTGGVELVAQRYRPGIGLVPVLRCKSCGAMWRLEERDEIEAVALHFRSAADRLPHDAPFMHAIADRILAGLDVREVPAPGLVLQ